jgi:hypothetical protein
MSYIYSPLVMSTIKQGKRTRPSKPEQLADLTPEERRQAIEGLDKKEFFRRLRTIKKWREGRLARHAKDSR